MKCKQWDCWAPFHATVGRGEAAGEPAGVSPRLEMRGNMTSADAARKALLEVAKRESGPEGRSEVENRPKQICLPCEISTLIASHPKLLCHGAPRCEGGWAVPLRYFISLMPARGGGGRGGGYHRIPHRDRYSDGISMPDRVHVHCKTYGSETGTSGPP